MRVLAVVCVRNEQVHIRRCLHDLIHHGVDVILLDHASTDQTLDIAHQFLDRGLIKIEHLSWTGFFNLSDQLKAKSNLFNRYRGEYDWVAHFDADEEIVVKPLYSCLLDAVCAADEAGFNCLNFNEFVMMPPRNQQALPDVEEFGGEHLDYYFFQNRYPRLMRVWKNNLNFDNVSAGGHLLQGENLRLYPVDFSLKHYIVLSHQHALSKYSKRSFSPEELSKGWHLNRVNINADTINRFFDGSMNCENRLFSLPDSESSSFETNYPQSSHFWEWN